ncbi:hypothetical protein Ciccas_013461 [Cichlidogyrus casuarinus]|uniref:Fibronectin type-III domain-containing protein n=1 Tax=Cichlidogyrus casuarinus TaxID=1844966 RepID=A0ABD2PL18_9PLAT
MIQTNKDVENDKNDYSDCSQQIQVDVKYVSDNLMSFEWKISDSEDSVQFNNVEIFYQGGFEYPKSTKFTSATSIDKVTLYGLIPCSTYYISFIFTDSVQHAICNATATLKVATNPTPLQRIADFRLTAPTNNQIGVEIVPIEPSLISPCVPLYYIITLSKQSQEIETIATQNASFQIIRNLSPKTEYSIRVQAYYQGATDRGVAFVKTIFVPDVDNGVFRPLEPAAVSITEIRSNSMRVGWKTPNSNLAGVYIFVQDLSEKNASFRMNTVFNASIESIVIRELLPCNNYAVRVVQFRIIQRVVIVGQVMKPLTRRTLPDTDSHLPETLVITQTSNFDDTQITIFTNTKCNDLTVNYSLEIFAIRPEVIIPFYRSNYSFTLTRLDHIRRVNIEKSLIPTTKYIARLTTYQISQPKDRTYYLESGIFQAMRLGEHFLIDLLFHIT